LGDRSKPLFAGQNPPDDPSKTADCTPESFVQSQLNGSLMAGTTLLMVQNHSFRGRNRTAGHSNPPYAWWNLLADRSKPLFAGQNPPDDPSKTADCRPEIIHAITA
jgi:hypothetical protein